MILRRGKRIFRRTNYPLIPRILHGLLWDRTRISVTWSSYTSCSFQTSGWWQIAILYCQFALVLIFVVQLSNGHV